MAQRWRTIANAVIKRVHVSTRAMRAPLPGACPTRGRPRLSSPDTARGLCDAGAASHTLGLLRYTRSGAPLRSYGVGFSAGSTSRFPDAVAVQRLRHVHDDE